ncbi:unnamed protein product [Heligmosomoides polygyrus]|uniref:Uncharacterized protein n=1 Tax=Heligmosomoides polygyrus TaxID=6339 RepID=A0A183FRX0_HELPZ|nr:unnamed protein product [Heligmosomoides polygyrus]
MKSSYNEFLPKNPGIEAILCGQSNSVYSRRTTRGQNLGAWRSDWEGSSSGGAGIQGTAITQLYTKEKSLMNDELLRLEKTSISSYGGWGARKDVERLPSAPNSPFRKRTAECSDVAAQEKAL